MKRHTVLLVCCTLTRCRAERYVAGIPKVDTCINLRPANNTAAEIRSYLDHACRVVVVVTSRVDLLSGATQKPPVALRVRGERSGRGRA